jgi:predicted PhzF superfamily epimerase YddE/YHI9
MDFPADVIRPIKPSAELLDCFDIEPAEVFKGGFDHMLVFKNEKEITHIGYDLDKMRRIKGRGIIITARGVKSDFVSRFFAPKLGVNEDPVTGSAHTTLIPYWSGVLDKKTMTAIQLSKRGGFLMCRNNDKRVEILGKAKTFMQGTITI